LILVVIDHTRSGLLRVVEESQVPEFCPKCGNMVADGTERCPACGARVQPRVMDKKTGFTWADFFNYSFVALLFALAAFLIPLLVLLACYGIYLLLGPGA
jgi:RNA polymerase subunit RPABC4/transcription elongation factor Spt4